MTDAEKITTVQAYVENDPQATDTLVSVYLAEAEDDILRRLYRAYGAVPEGATMPTMYDLMQCKLASRRFLRRGGQGEVLHTENNVNRTYHSTDDEEILKDVMPFAKVVG